MRLREIMSRRSFRRALTTEEVVGRASFTSFGEHSLHERREEDTDLREKTRASEHYTGFRTAWKVFRLRSRDRIFRGDNRGGDSRNERIFNEERASEPTRSYLRCYSYCTTTLRANNVFPAGTRKFYQRERANRRIFFYRKHRQSPPNPDPRG